ncbi:MaoC/PaaZ C-terminal domain-containing protein [Prescottella equi]|uniref:MaoC/PaaZ C-terminal domain-containing protein n=1 Tax=Rhodococcus hoagii TaxID=43767 RepID=UPI000A10F59F|nr:MaoC/PaaZ C-terminal domain-containing protein [Prescottella equi]MBM4637387.1 dehydratase [Prescottella equi]MBM4669072.1 dehydratase [Prescottella equi]NKT44679.1 dehydratase [Prescottella equi]NKV89304.1 dehydratase [Prescottella equi]ORL13920.1 dehydratase [Prescottella equi]
MTTPTVEFDTSGIGVWTDPERFEVTAERIAEYAAATNDPIERHLRGEIAPPVFAVVPAFTSMAPAALSVAPVELLMKLVHGEQDFHFHRPIRPGDTLVVRAKPVGFAGKENGSTVVVYVETRTDAGELVNEQWMTAFFRKVDAGPGTGASAPTHRFDEALRATDPAAVVTAHIDEDQTFRYSPASGDPMPIHLDDEIARMSGLPGIINHGLCTMAFTSWAALTEFADGDVERLKRLAVRFAKPVLPGQDIETRFRRSGSESGTTTTYAYETGVGDELVIKDGLAVIAD